MEKVLRTSEYYSFSFNKRVVLNGRISVEGARKKYNIGCNITVSRWLRAYKKVLKKKKVLTLSSMKENKKEQQDPKAQLQSSNSEELARLKKELERALLYR